MVPTLQKVILNGASRHCVNKGFIIVSDNLSPIEPSVRSRIIDIANPALATLEFVAEPRSSHHSIIGLKTPFLSVYDVRQRDIFIKSLAKATNILLHAARSFSCKLTATGVNPFVADSNNQVAALCADLHQIEVFDDGEIERVYNLFRQFLPELLAISTHSAVYGGAIQKDFSLRMRVNPASFLPRYLSQFSTQHLDKLRNMMRKDYGLADLQQMDINPLAGDSEKLTADNLSLLSSNPAAAELRFIDAQSAYPFIRAQIILFQAIAMYGRSLARAGKRLPYMRDEVIDENKALAVQNGPGAIFKPDERFSKTDGRAGLSFHDEGNPERATSALLITLERLLLPYVRELGCQYWELAPIILGAELRRSGRQCFANYAEYQKYLYYTYSLQFSTVFQEQIEQLLSSHSLDYITDFNQRTYPELAQNIEREWTKKLQLPSRYKGRVKWYNFKQAQGYIRSDQGEDFHVQQSDIEGGDHLEENQVVTFEILKRGKRLSAIRVRLERVERYKGQIFHVERSKGFGFIRMADRKDKVYLHHSDVIGGQKFHVGDTALFEIQKEEKGLKAIRVKIQPRLQGEVKQFDLERYYGWIALPDGSEIFVHQKDLVGFSELKEKQRVSFDIEETDKGRKAVRVRIVGEARS